MKYLFFVCCLLTTSLLSQSQWTTGTGLIYYNGGNVGIGTTTPMTGSNNAGLQISKGHHSTLILGNPFQDGQGGIIQTSDARHRIFLGANLYDDITTNWTSINPSKGAAGLSLVADQGGWGTQIGFYLSEDGSLNERMTILGNGNVGIGTTTPGTRFQVEGVQLINGDLRLGRDHNSVGYGKAIEFGYQSNSDPIWMARYNTGVDQSELRVNLGDDANDRFVIGYHYHLNDSWIPSVSITSSGQLSVGTTYIPAGYRLAVGGNIIAEKVKVQLQQNWPDYVFNPTYSLRPLKEVELYIQQHHHLPEVPSVEDVNKEGLDLGDNQATLLKKIEELTLYLIEQNKKMDEQIKRNEEQQREIDELKKQLQNCRY